MPSKFSAKEREVFLKNLTTLPQYLSLYRRNKYSCQKKKISTKILCAIFATGILSFCGVAGETAMNITFPVLMKAFSVNTSTVQWVTTIYLLVVACVVPLSAYLKRSFKMKTIFLVANLLSILGVLIDFIAPSFSFVVLGRLVQGMGVGFALPLMFNIILGAGAKS